MTAITQTLQTRLLAPEAVPFSMAQAEKFLHLRPTSPQRPAMQVLLRQEHAVCLPLFAPRYQYRICAVEQMRSAAKEIILQDGIIFHGAAVLRRLRRAESAALFLLSAGDAPTAGAASPETAFLRDAIASAMAQGVLEVLQQELRMAVKESGCRLTPRLSPGYPGWPLSDQRRLFAALQPQAVDVRLTKACFMRPQKSLSGLFGLLHDEASQN